MDNGDERSQDFAKKVHPRVSIITIAGSGKSLELPKCLHQGARVNEQGRTLECYVVIKTYVTEV